MSTPVCPKQMTFGPCGGVEHDGGCEVDGRPCPFVAGHVTTEWDGRPRRPRSIDLGSTLVDVRIPASDADLARIGEILARVGATALIGEHVDDPIPLDPGRTAERVAATGLRAVVTVTARDRTLVGHRQAIDHVDRAGALAVHCVTGDHPAARFGPQATARFSGDGTRLAALARSAGARVSVAESPSAAPAAARARRVRSKERAGADVVVLNHCGAPADAIRFADECRRLGCELAIVAPVPVITDVASARALRAFPGLHLPDGMVEGIIGASDPRAEGIAVATSLGRELMASGRFAAVNLSGSAGDVDPVERAELMAAVATGIVRGRPATGAGRGGPEWRR